MDLMHNRRALIIMNMMAVLTLFLFGWLFFRGDSRDHRSWVQLQVRDLSEALLTYAVMIVLHEAAHSLFFYPITKSRPVFALCDLYAYAATPDWAPYLFTCLVLRVLSGGSWGTSMMTSLAPHIGTGIRWIA